MKTVLLCNLGKLSYVQAYQVQSRLLEKHLQGKHEQLEANDVLLIAEHDPVYTVGLRSKQYKNDVKILKSKGADFVFTDRGGLITFHGPGQLMAYPVLNLKNHNLSIKYYITKLEQTIINTCRMLNINADVNKHTGVWIDNSKICAIGIHVKRYITTHGLALNCNVNLHWFNNIVPCGLEGCKTTSLSEVLKRNVSAHDVLPLFLKCFSDEFHCYIKKSPFDISYFNSK